MQNVMLQWILAMHMHMKKHYEEISYVALKRCKVHMLCTTLVIAIDPAFGPIGVDLSLLCVPFILSDLFCKMMQRQTRGSIQHAR